MKGIFRWRFLAAGVATCAIGVLWSTAWAQVNTTPAQHGAVTYWYPNSNKQKPADVGVRAHTNVIGVIFPEPNRKPHAAKSASSFNPNVTLPVAGDYFETPASLACVYGFVTQTTGCNPSTATAVIAGGAAASIAIVDAYDNPNAATDLTTFDTEFGLPAPPSFQVVYASGATAPPVDPTGGWELESSLDIEWAHAMSPNAKIYLVEAASNSNTDLLAAVDKAASLVSADGGGVVSMSWGESEASGESTNDKHFQKANVTFFASTGDAPGTEWPSVSPYVVAVGGTSISRNPANGNYIAELVWQQTGSGISSVVSRPTYQAAVSSVVGTKRGVPDIAGVADPNTGVWVYSGSNGGWFIVGGTSVASPVEAGIVSYKGLKYASYTGFLTNLYSGNAGNTRDIVSGNCGPYAGYVAGTSYDLCTGRGSLLGGLRLNVAGASVP